MSDVYYFAVPFDRFESLLALLGNQVPITASYVLGYDLVVPMKPEDRAAGPLRGQDQVRVLVRLASSQVADLLFAGGFPEWLDDCRTSKWTRVESKHYVNYQRTEDKSFGYSPSRNPVLHQ